MLSISDYIKIIMDKKNMTNMDLVRKINKIEEEAGVEERTKKQNITSYLNGYQSWGYEFVRKVEVALELRDGFLMRMLGKPKTRDSRKRYEEIMKKYRVKK